MNSEELFKLTREHFIMSYASEHKRIGDLFDISKYKSSKKPYVSNMAFAEDVAKKYYLGISEKLIYLTDGSSEISRQRLTEARDEIKKIMYVSPILWIPTKENVRQFGFGFVPFFNKIDFKYNADITVNNLMSSDSKQIFELQKNISEKNLSDLLSMRTKLISLGQKPEPIVIKNSRTFELCNFGRNFDEYYFSGNDDEYPVDLSSEDFFKTVIKDYNLKNYVVEDIKTVFVPNEECSYDTIIKVISIIMKRLNVSLFAGEELRIDGEFRRYYFFNYDDSELDFVSGQMRLFYWDRDFFG